MEGISKRNTLSRKRVESYQYRLWPSLAPSPQLSTITPSSSDVGTERTHVRTPQPLNFSLQFSFTSKPTLSCTKAERKCEEWTKEQIKAQNCRDSLKMARNSVTPRSGVGLHDVWTSFRPAMASAHPRNRLPASAIGAWQRGTPPTFGVNITYSAYLWDMKAQFSVASAIGPAIFFYMRWSSDGYGPTARRLEFPLGESLHGSTRSPVMQYVEDTLERMLVFMQNCLVSR
jgi:hypothetical protein